MINRNDEKLSALVDNEVGEWELRTVVQSLNHDQELQAGWRNYHLIGDAMRGTLPDHVCPDLTDRISHALENEPHHFNPQIAAASVASNTAGKTRATVGFALAASISAVAVVGVMGIDQDNGMPGQQMSVAATAQGTLNPEARPVLSSLLNELAASDSDTQRSPVSGFRTVSASGAQNMTPDLYDYLKNYQQYSAQRGGDDPLSYLRVVSHGTGQ